jgi:hypothetical protein
MFSFGEGTCWWIRIIWEDSQPMCPQTPLLLFYRHTMHLRIYQLWKVGRNWICKCFEKNYLL